MRTPREPKRYQQETGAMGVPASLLFVIFLLRGCN